MDIYKENSLIFFSDVAGQSFYKIHICKFYFKQARKSFRKRSPINEQE